MAGGMWSVAYTDALQLGLVAVGLALALPVALDAVGGLDRAWGVYAVRGRTRRPSCRRSTATGTLDPPAHRVVVGRERDARARRHPVELLLPARAVVPDAARRRAALDLRRPADDRPDRAAAAARPGGLRLSVAAATCRAARRAAGRRVPLVFRDVTPPARRPCSASPRSSAPSRRASSSSILSAGSMFSWNTCTRLLRPNLRSRT